jgi:DNA-binding HxlR family transcriptional regulator
VEKSNSLNLEPLLELVHNRWGLPILAQLHRSEGCKFVTLHNRLHLSKDSLSRTLSALLEQNLVMRNPGYGHPLRPEYILTGAGEQIGGQAFELMANLERLGVTDVALRKWSLPILLVLQDDPRFTDLLERLPGLTSRALVLGLDQLAQAELLEVFRNLTDSRNSYRLNASGQQLASSVQLLAETLAISKNTRRLQPSNRVALQGQIKI